MSEATLEQRYEILEARQGGQAIVYRAVDRQLNWTVAIRAPNSETCGDPRRLERFRESLQALGQIHDPHVLAVHHFYPEGELGPTCFAVSDWYDTTLETVLRDEQLAPETGMGIIRALLTGLRAIHATGRIHGDLRPENILLSGDATRVVIADLGGREGTVGNCARYTAPEVLDGNAEIEPRSDLYAVGMIALEILLGLERFRSVFEEVYAGDDDSVHELRWLNWQRDPERKIPPLSELFPELPCATADAIDSLLCKNCEQRPADADSALRALGDVPALGAHISTSGLTATRGRAPWHKRWASAGTAVAACLAIVVVGGSQCARTSTARASAIEAGQRMVEARETARASGAHEAAVALYEQAESNRSRGREAFDGSDFEQALAAFERGRELFLQVSRDATTLAARDNRVQVGSTAEEIDAALQLCETHEQACDRNWYASETLREISVNAFELDSTEVTNEAFAAFVAATGYESDAEQRGFAYRWAGYGSLPAHGFSWKQPNGPGSSYRDRLRHPVVAVSANDAREYCGWAGGRLPTEEEWEYAARGRARRIFPWGNDWEPERVAWKPSEDAATRPTGLLPQGATPQGVLDLAGGVWEWTQSDDPSKTAKGAVLKGGSFAESNPANLRSAARRLSPPDQGHLDDGFRCLVEASARSDLAAAATH